jgi:hypothetical protein
VERLAAEEPDGAQSRTAEKAMFQEGQPGVLRAGGGEAARTWQEGGKAPLVGREQGDEKAGQEVLSRSVLSRSPSPPSRRRSSARKDWKSAVFASGFRCTTRSIAGRLLRRFHRR